jgi:hypothetical protein
LDTKAVCTVLYRELAETGILCSVGALAALSGLKNGIVVVSVVGEDFSFRKHKKTAKTETLANARQTGR